MPEDGAPWSIALEAWVIQDGNYDDFSVGDRAEFAVEFYAREQAQVAIGERPLTDDVGDGQYDVTARVDHIDGRGWVLDLGIKAYRKQTPPKGVRTGDMVRTRLSLGIDPFFYFEDLARDAAWPNLIYTWDVREIWRVTVPIISRGNVHVRDEANRTSVSVPRTDARNDGAAHSHYVLICEVASLKPKRSSTTTR